MSRYTDFETKKEKGAFLDYLKKAENIDFKPLSCEVFAKKLPFYKDASLILLIDYSEKSPRVLNLINGDSAVYIIDGSNGPIYQANADIGMRLSEKTVHSYVDFFFHHVAGRYGRFVITKTVDDLVPLDAKKKIPAKLTKIFATTDQKMVEKTGNGFCVTRLMQFKDSLFKSFVNVEANGTVELDKEKIVFEDLSDFVQDVWYPGKLKKSKKSDKKQQLDVTDETVSWGEIS